MSNVPAVVVLGAVLGLQAGLLGVGLVLIYRANRFINFAQGAMGALAASALAVLVFNLGVPYWIALLLALLVGAVTGGVVERLLGWRLFAKSRLTLMVATIGIAQLCLLAVLVGPLKIDPGKLTSIGYPEPFTLHWHIGKLVLSSSQVTTLIAGPVIALALFLFLDRTRTGKAIRGAASNPDAARLAGISVRQMSLIVWVLAGLVSALAAILLAPDQSALTFGDSGGGLLLRGLAAALLAGMYDFRIAFVAGVGIGVIEELTVFYTNVPGLAVLSVALIVVIGLLVRAHALGRDVALDEGLVVETSEVSPSTRVREWFAFRHAGRLGWLGLFALMAIAPLIPGLQSQERAVFLLFMVSYAMAGLGLTVLTGWAGQVSLGQFAFLGVGAFAAAYVDRHNLGIPLMFIVAGLAAALVSVLVGLVAVRFRGLFLGVVTLAFAFVARGWLFRQQKVTQDSGGVVHISHAHLFGMAISTVRGAYLLGVVVLALTVLALRSLRASSAGRAIIAVRDNDDQAAAYGIPPTAVKVGALAISGFIAGLGGALWGMAAGTWSFTSFDPTMSFVLLSCVIVGGIGTLYGPILGTLVVFAYPYLVPNADTLVNRSLTSGVLLLIVLLFVPGGVASLLASARRRLFDFLDRTLPALPKLEFGPQPGETPLEAADVHVSFGGIKALDGASITVSDGEIVGLIGGNGAGKSTLLNCISGVLEPDHGVIRVQGREVQGLAPEFRPSLGLTRTFQDARLFRGLTVEETVTVAMDRGDRSGALGSLLWAPWVREAERKKKARAREILDSFGLTDRAEALTNELSTGMRRVCDLAAVVATKPSIVLLDEPTAGLAQREVEAFAPLLRKLRDEHGCSVLLVEHDMPLLMSLCDRIYCMEEGRVIAEGDPHEIRSDARVIASYLGTQAAAIDRSTGNGTNGKRRSAANGKRSAAGNGKPRQGRTEVSAQSAGRGVRARKEVSP